MFVKSESLIFNVYMFFCFKEVLPKKNNKNSVENVIIASVLNLKSPEVVQTWKML